MELLLQIEKYDDSVNGDGLSKAEQDEIIDLIPIEGDKNIKVVNNGPGADVLVILAVINLVVDVFLIGDRVINGIDGWVKLGKKIKGILSNKELVSVDNDGATMLAIEFISNYEKITSLKKTDEMCINLADLGSMMGEASTLTLRPHNYYVQTYLINDESYYVVGVKSSGETNLIKCFAWNQYGIMEVDK